MRGIEVFLVTKQNDEDVCYMELRECDYYENEEYSIMYVFSGNKSGISLIGKFNEKEVIEKQLKDFYRKEINNEIKKLKKQAKAFRKTKK